MNTCIILNPNAGTADEITEFEASLQDLGEVTIRKTREAGDAKLFAEEALDNGYDLVVAAGGDGTINEVVNGLSKDFAKARMGIIPLGTGNDFARSINVPNGAEAVNVLKAAHIRALDVVRVTSSFVRYFINVSAGGFSGIVNEKLTDEMKQSWGPLAYLRSAVSAIPDLTDYHTYIKFNDKPPVRLKTYNIVVANGRYVAGGIPIAPQAELDDGLLDIIIVPAESMLKLALLVPQILNGQHLSSDTIIYKRARKVKIDSQPGIWFNVDGELVGNEPAEFEVLPRTLEVIVGQAN